MLPDQYLSALTFISGGAVFGTLLLMAQEWLLPANPDDDMPPQPERRTPPMALDTTAVDAAYAVAKTALDTAQQSAAVSAARAQTSAQAAADASAALSQAAQDAAGLDRARLAFDAAVDAFFHVTPLAPLPPQAPPAIAHLR